MVVPFEALLATPLELIVATATSEEVHAACTVILTAEPSLKVPCAVNVCEDPKLIAELAGVTAIETKVALVTVSVVVALIPENAAVIVVVPVVTPVATPPLPDALLTVATDGVDEVQVTAEVRSNCWPSEKVPIALSWVSMVAGSLRLCGVILMDTRLDPSTTRCELALNVPEVAVMVAVPAD